MNPERLQELLEYLPEAILDLDGCGRIVLLNSAVEKMFGYDSGELLGCPVERLLPKGLRGAGLYGRRKDGAEFPVEIRLIPAQCEEGSPVSALILHSSFLAGVSHDLRGPLHTIIGFSELLAEQREGPLNEKQIRFVHHIHEDSRRLLELIDEALDKGTTCEEIL